MKKMIYSFVLLSISACTTVPITGRQQLKLIPDSELNTLAFQNYSEFLKTHQLSANQKEVLMVSNVGNNIKMAVENYLRNNGKSNVINGFEWEFNLVENEQVNAWAMPGGKIVFYTGIIPYCDNEQGIAVVMGHEIAHIIAGHGNERMSQGLLAQLGGMAFSAALEKKPEQTQNIFLSAYGLGAQIGVLLPFSRIHEKEADRLGLIFMTMAGYDPYAAPEFWKRMTESSKGKEPPEFLSTHPSNTTRITELEAAISEALTYKK